MGGDRVIWNDGMPLKEVDGPWGNTVFSGNRRAGSFGLLVGALVCAGFAWGAYRMTGSPALLAVGGLTGAGLLAGAIFTIWTQRVIVVDHHRRELALVRTSPWRTRRTAYPFASLREIRVEEVMDSEADRVDWLARVLVNMDDGTQIVLGRTYPDSAVAFARRIAGLTGARLATD